MGEHWSGKGQQGAAMPAGVERDSSSPLPPAAPALSGVMVERRPVLFLFFHIFNNVHKPMEETMAQR